MFLIYIFLFGLTGILCEDLYSFTVKDWQGNDVSLGQYRGKVCRNASNEEENTICSFLGFIGSECKFSRRERMKSDVYLLNKGR